jgi:crotonobetainyl-CoA:carnitine CoA-transferase CaiB-like acyl-CoA transferase
MTQVMDGIKVVELASWTFVPAAGAILAEWGADVVKVEHPRHPDPQRGLVRGGLSATGPNAILEQANRGKRSLAVDIATPSGIDVLHDLVRGADVFLTNWLPTARAKRSVDVHDLRAVNPALIYARGHGLGPRGDEADRPGFDSSVYVARGGFASVLTPRGAEWPIVGSSAIGDLPGAMSLAGGVSAALFHRLRTGEATVVDVSLLGQAMWTIAADVVTAGILGHNPPRLAREENPNPLSIQYRTADGRFIRLAMLESDRFFAGLSIALGAPSLADDARFTDAAARQDHHRECIAALDEVIGQLTLAELGERLHAFEGAWGAVQEPIDILDDPQARANGYLRAVGEERGETIEVVSAPVAFNDAPPPAGHGAPEHGQHTEEILLELGRDWDDIAQLQTRGVI